MENHYWNIVTHEGRLWNDIIAHGYIDRGQADVRELVVGVRVAVGPGRARLVDAVAGEICKMVQTNRRVDHLLPGAGTVIHFRQQLTAMAAILVLGLFCKSRRDCRQEATAVDDGVE